ncbi:MAG: GerMN domain-containing protein, partial [Microcystaceae cyanobacterium]
RKHNRSSIGWIAGTAIAILAAGGGAAWWTRQQLTSSTSTALTSTEPSTSTPSKSQPVQPAIDKPQKQPVAKQPLPEERVKIYWLKVTETKTQLLPSVVTIQQKSANKHEVLEMALKDLLAGPPDASHTTTIPQGTKLLGVTTAKNGVHINLSQEFTTGGGSDSMIGRLAQILYTATSLDPEGQVWIDVEGKPLELLGEGDGIIVDQPMTRQFFEESFEL